MACCSHSLCRRDRHAAMKDVTDFSPSSANRPPSPPASIPAFSSRLSQAGVKPRAENSAVPLVSPVGDVSRRPSPHNPRKRAKFGNRARAAPGCHRITMMILGSAPHPLDFGLAGTIWRSGRIKSGPARAFIFTAADAVIDGLMAVEDALNLIRRRGRPHRHQGAATTNSF